MAIEVLKKADNVDGNDLQYFIKEFWKDLCPLPKASNPAWLNDGSKDPSFNSGGQSLFRLCFSRNPQAAVTRNIHVPSGKGLFIPIMSVVVSLCEKPKADIIHIAKNDQVSIFPPSLKLTLDGEVFQAIEAYKFNPEEIGTIPVSFPDPSEAIFPIVSKGPCDGAIAGRYVWTKPLEAGTHTVSWTGKLHCVGGDCIDIDYSENITYNIKVP